MSFKDTYGDTTVHITVHRVPSQKISGIRSCYVLITMCVCSLSSSVLQGFTCVAVRSIEKVQIKRLIKACRRKGRNKVILTETQVRLCFTAPMVKSFKCRIPGVTEFCLGVRKCLTKVFHSSPTADLHVQPH